MKKLLCIFALSLVFSACSQQSAEPVPTPQPTEEVADFSMEVLQTELDELETSDYLYYGWEKDFEAEGLGAEISNVTLVDKDYAAFDINISNGTDTLVLPIKAELLYYMHEEIPRGIQTQWGHINVADGQLILTKYDFDKGCSVIEHYNAKTLQLVDAVETQNPADLRLLNTALYNGGFISQYWISDRDMGILLIRRDGLVEQQIIFNGGYAYRNDSDYNHHYRFYSQDIELLTADLILVGGSDLYSLQSGQCHSVSSICGYTQGDTVFKLYRSNSGNKAIKPYFALLYKNGKVTDSFFADGVDIHEGFANTENTDYKPVQYTFSANGRAITIVCDLTQLTLTADFDGRTLQGQYNITEDRLEYEYAKSADGRLSLWRGATAGGGDYYVNALIAKDNTTGQLKYLGCPGGMYGGGADWGFFKNGDMYIFGRSEFTVFSSDLNVEQPIFKMSENFPLGTVNEDDVLCRYLFAVRRDPETFGYTVVYTDVPYYYGLKYADLGNYYDYSENYNYNVALLDAQGKAYKHIKTDIDVKTTAFGYVNMNMYLRDDGLMHMTTWVKNPENIFDDFTVDINTGKVTDLMKEKYTDEITAAAAEIIQPAADFIRNLKGGAFVDMERPIDEKLNPYSSKPPLYAMQKDYCITPYLSDAAEKYYLDSFAEYAIYPDLTHYRTDGVRFFTEINGEIWCNIDLCKDIERKIFDTDSIKVESLTGGACVVRVQYHTETNDEKQTAYYSMCRNYSNNTLPQWVFTSLVI